MYHRRIIVAVAVAEVGPPAVAHAQPTLQFDRACYAEQQEIRFTGTGYTPGGQVDVVFATHDAARRVHDRRRRRRRVRRRAERRPADQLLDQDEDRETIS